MFVTSMCKQVERYTDKHGCEDLWGLNQPLIKGKSLKGKFAIFDITHRLAVISMQRQ